MKESGHWGQHPQHGDSIGPAASVSCENSAWSWVMVTESICLVIECRYGNSEGRPHLDIGGRPRGKLGTGRSIHSAEVAQHGLLDVLQLLARVGVLHVADADAQPVRVHVVVIVTQRLCREAASAHHGSASHYWVAQ